MKRLLLLGLVLGLLTASTPAGFASGTHAGINGTVSGTVLTPAGRAVPDAMVQLEVQEPSGRLYSASTLSDANGHFGFRDVPPGQGMASARHASGARGHARVSVRAGHVSRVTIVLTRP